jgi:hypothetical protein
MLGSKKKKDPPASLPPPPRKQGGDADELVKGNYSLEYLDEPYIVVVSSRRSTVNLVYAMNLVAKEKGYRLASFAVSEVFAYTIMEKRTDDESGGDGRGGQIEQR